LVDPAIDYHVRGDAHHLSQVLLNLLSNAIKFTESGFVELSVKLKAETATGLMLRFEVRDSGIGIPEAAQVHIFERFVQADDSTTRKYGGTGLGTTIAKQLVELMGGTIGLASKIGTGSMFWFEIPLLRAQPEDSAATSINEVASAALIIAEDADLARMQQMAASVCTTFYTANPDDDVCSYVERLRSDDIQVSALFYGGGMQRAQELFNQLAEDPRNASTALIYVASAADYLPEAEMLRRIEGVNFIDANAPPRHLRNAIHAATSKGNSVGQVIDLRAVLEEQRSKLKILVAEDNATNQQIIKQLLEKAGHEVVIASDGEEALDLYEATAAELAILDFNMPERNGLEVTKAIRAMEATGVHLPIMILSASVTTEARDRARRAGADEFVGKPYDAAELLHTIDRMARRARSMQRGVGQREEGKRQSTGEVHALSPKAALIDTRRMAEVQRIAGDSQFLSRLIQGFEKDVTRLLDELDANVTSGKLAPIGDLVHALKGAALGIGAARFGALCVEIEKLAGSGQLTATRNMICQLRGCFAETSAQLTAYALGDRQALGR
jgi:two-component system sensor histidine kinase RpfC